MPIDPAAEAALLVPARGRDLQTGAAETSAFFGGLPRRQIEVLPSMNHVLKDVGEDRSGNLAAYHDPRRPLAVGLVDAIDAFVRREIGA
ncbi:hypothetical protein QNA08_10570 [Chelatococcus sp. SYSU_G07232]|uniref:Alpha/beta hydrolase n=1 Tax=Chelatococcus albus TaxID=3047466 RepID=A0ABT7AI66_9HYPH|nr:hypothetical protein [Chelatococcus sp. SYSU_G07232]MDJ1158677.1 hypothetical protein [Chelatococcus sp. SYSU_G07232]